jgi:predicted GNAT family N-acyltransferase
MNPSQASAITVRKAETDLEFNHVFDIRTQVFVGEQEVDQEDDFDGFDHLSEHYLALFEGEPAGTSRWRMTSNGQVRLERFAVKEDFRGKGIGKALLQAMLQEIPSGYPLFLHAQTFTQPYYQKMGFEAEGEAFEEAGMPHIRMTYQPMVTP